MSDRSVESYIVGAVGIISPANLPCWIFAKLIICQRTHGSVNFYMTSGAVISNFDQI